MLTPVSLTTLDGEIWHELKSILFSSGIYSWWLKTYIFKEHIIPYSLNSKKEMKHFSDSFSEEHLTKKQKILKIIKVIQK